MRAGRIWHPRLVSIMTRLGHNEMLVLADAGLPVPNGVETVDLLWGRGEPPLLGVLEAMVAEMEVDYATVASEATNADFLAGVQRVLASCPAVTVPHDELKQLTRCARAVVRTGECTPYANVILHGGVTF